MHARGGIIWLSISRSLGFRSFQENRGFFCSRCRETSWGSSHSSVYSDRKVGLCKVQNGAHAAHRCACVSRSHRLLCSSAHERAHEAPSVKTEVEVKEGFEEGKPPENLFRDEDKPRFGPKIKDESLFMSVVDIAKKRRGQDLRELDSRQYTVMKPLCDYIVIASYHSRLQMLSAARSVRSYAKDKNFRVEKIDSQGNKTMEYPSVEGTDSDRWMIVDMGPVVFHAFSKEGRSYYALEEHWEEAQRAHEAEGISHEEFIRRNIYNYKTSEA